MYCKHCGKLIDDSSLFCKFCGKKVQEIENDFSPKDTVSMEENVNKVPVVEYKDGFFFKDVSLPNKVLLSAVAFVFCIIIACITFVVCYPENISQLIDLLI